MLGDNPVRLLVKAPVRDPFVVLEPLTVGPVVVAQHMPLTEIVPPPLDMIFPPEIAVVRVIPVIADVVRVGTTIGLVVNDKSFPYAVPALLVAYARI